MSSDPRDNYKPEVRKQGWRPNVTPWRLNADGVIEDFVGGVWVARK